MDHSASSLDQLLKQINRGDRWIKRTSPRHRGKMAEELLHRNAQGFSRSAWTGLE